MYLNYLQLVCKEMSTVILDTCIRYYSRGQHGVLVSALYIISINNNAHQTWIQTPSCSLLFPCARNFTPIA